MEAEKGWSSGYVYVDEGNYLSRLPINRDLWTKLYDEWEALPADEHWSVIRYYLAEGKFNVSFRYKGETALVFDSVERASRDDAIAREFFGDKPIHYPPPPAHAFDLSDERQGFDGPLG